MPTDPYAVVPENATPENVAEHVDAYAKYLMEMTRTDFQSDPERVRKVMRNLPRLESTIAYFMGFLLDRDGSTDPVTDESRWQISELRTAYKDTYTVPDIEASAFKQSKNLHKLARASARASVERRTATLAPVATIAPPATADTMEATFARALGLTIDEYRALDLEG